MRSNWLTVGFLAGAALLSVALVLVLLFDRPQNVPPPAEVMRSVKVCGSAGDAAKGRTVTQVRQSSTLPRTPIAQSPKAAEAQSAARDDGELSDAALMDKVVDELMCALDEAIARKDFKTVLALADKLRALNYGRLADGRTARSAGSIKLKLLAALLEEGSAAGVGVAIDLLGDANQAVAESAESLLFKSLRDRSLGDYRRAEIVTAAAGELTNTLSLNKLFNEFIKMRHSVGTGALIEISQSGTEEAKAILPRVVGAFTGDTRISTVDELNAWLADNPDKAIDDSFYGPAIPLGSR